MNCATAAAAAMPASVSDAAALGQVTSEAARRGRQLRAAGLVL